MALRICKTCGKEAHTPQDLEAFKKSKRHSHGRANICKDCVAKATLENYHRNKDRINKGRAKRRLENLDEMREREREYRETHREELRRNSAKWRLKNREIIAEKDRTKILFKSKRDRRQENPRKGVCSECGRQYPEELKHQTVMHHEHYNSEDPLKDTTELCKSCHGKLHYERGDMWGLNLHGA